MIALGIDSGTQSTKTIAVDLETGQILATAQKAYGLIPDLAPGHLEQHPEDWITAVDGSVEEVLQALGGRKQEVVAIGVSGQQHGFVPLDEAGKVIRPAKLWCDTSTVDQCKQYETAFGGADELIRLSGNAMLPGYTAPKILWLKQNEPQHYRALRKVLLPHDYINFHLTGEYAMEYGDASGTGLMDVRTRQWSKPLVDFIDPDLAGALPAISSSRRAIGLLRESLRSRWGLEKSPVVSAGGGDNMMGAIGTGNVQAGVVTVSLGTSGTVFACATEPVVDTKGEIAAFCDSTDRWMPLVCTMNVTVATEQIRKTFGWSHDEMERQIRSVPAGADGLLFLPYLNGERTPNLPLGTGVMHGLTTVTMQAAWMARAVMEGVTLGLAYGVERFKSLGIAPSEIRLTGGGSKSALWRQICADVFGVSTVCLKSAEGAALGAAIQGAYAYLSAQGKPVTFSDLCQKLVEVDSSTRCTPSEENAEVYQRQLARQGELTTRLHGAGYL